MLDLSAVQGTILTEARRITIYSLTFSVLATSHMKRHFAIFGEGHQGTKYKESETATTSGAGQHVSTKSGQSHKGFLASVHGPTWMMPASSCMSTCPCDSSNCYCSAVYVVTVVMTTVPVDCQLDTGAGKHFEGF
jgi:hypothetical protein